MKKMLKYFKYIFKMGTEEIPNYIVCRRILNKWKNDNLTIYIVCPFGIGDTLFIASLIRAYKEHFGIARVILIVKNSQADLPDFFESIDGKIVSNKLVNRFMRYSRTWRRFKEENYQYGHFILDNAWPEPGRLLGIGNVNLIDIYKRCVLKIPLNTKLEFPKISVGITRMKELEKKYDKNEKVVLLMPYAVTLERLPMEFWEMMVQYYRKMSYRVYTNVKDETEIVIKGSESVCLSLKELFVVCDTFGWNCIALRSGICDLLGYSSSRLVTIHNNEDVKTAWNMCNLQLPNPNMVDLCWDQKKTVVDNFEMIIKKINFDYKEEKCK